MLAFGFGSLLFYSMISDKCILGHFLPVLNQGSPVHEGHTAPEASVAERLPPLPWVKAGSCTPHPECSALFLACRAAAHPSSSPGLSSPPLK